MNRLTNIFQAFTRTERFLFIAAAGVIVLAGGSLIALAVSGLTIVVPARGGTLTEGMVGQPTYVNPILAETDADKGLVRLLFAPLQNLAEKIEADATNRAWRVRLKEGLRWSDGVKITSDDVIFTVQNIQTVETRSPLYASWLGVTVNRLSELEFQFNLVSPYPFFGENLAEFYPIPKHIFANTPSANWRLSDYNLKPTGSGPYAFESYEKEPSGFIPSYTLVANPNYAADRAFIDTFVLRFFGKTSDAIAAFDAGTVDAFADFNPETVGKVVRPAVAIRYTIPSYYAVFLNQSQNAALKEPKVRMALVRSVDRVALVDAVLGGGGKIATGPLISSQDKPDTDPLFKPEEASALLDEAGWVPATSTDGIRTKTEKNVSEELSFDLTTPDAPFLLATAQTLKNSWAKLGIGVNVVSAPAEKVLDRVVKRDYQALLFGNFLNPGRDLYPFWHSNERFYPGLNLSIYENKDVDDLIERIRREPQESVRSTELANLETIIAQDAPAVFLYSPDYLYIVGKNLQGLRGGPIRTPADRYQNAAMWYLKTTRTLK